MYENECCAAKFVSLLIALVLYFTVLPLVAVWAWNALLPFWAQAGLHLPVAHYKEMWLLMLLTFLLLR